MHPRLLAVCCVLSAFLGSAGQAFTIQFSDADFSATPAFSNVTTFAFSIEIGAPLQAGLYADPAITDIQYSVSGSLDPTTPSGFPSFAFALNHIFPTSPPITGAAFYALNPSAAPGQTLRFQVAAGADLSDGLQVAELEDLGGGVVFRFDGREEGTGRYHPAFLELRADGTGTLQNADNFGGVNPFTNQVVNVARGDEYVTHLTFDPNTFTIASVPEPSLAVLALVATAVLRLRARRREC